MKHLTINILLCMFISMVGTKSLAYYRHYNDYTCCINGIYYYLSGSNAKVTYCYYEYDTDYWGNVHIYDYYGYSGDVVIPESVTYGGATYIVTEIGYNAFNGMNVTSVTIPCSVTKIYGGAFKSTSSLTRVGISDLSAWCNIEFENASSNPLSHAHLYLNDEEVKDLIIPNSVNNIGDYAFYSCTGLTSVDIPNSVNSIGSNAFQGCYGLTNVKLHCKSIYNWFSELSNISNVILGEEVESINNGAFWKCSGLTSVIIPNSVTSIGSSAFASCGRLESVIIGTGVQSIGLYVFEYHKPAKVIWLTNTPPSGYGNAAGMVNYVANNLYTNLNNKAEYPFLSSLFEVDGVKYVPVVPSERTCDAIDCLYDESAANVNIGETVSYRGVEMTVKGVRKYACYRNQYINNVELSFNGDVEDNAFYGCTNISQVTATNGGNIGAYTFQGCIGLSQLSISNNGNIGASAFQGITSEFTANINNSGYLGKEAFYGSTGLKTLQVGSNVTDINASAFYGCSGLTIAQLMNKGSIGASAFQGCTAMTSATLGEAVTGIGDKTFYGCSSLLSIIIPNAVTNLGQYAFSDCSMMGYAVMGTGVKTISTYAFSGCTSLTAMQIGSNVETIATYAFNNCKSLPEIEIPQAVTDIKDNVFQGCTSLKNVVMADRTTILNLGYNKTSSNNGNPLFSSCPLDSVYIGGNISYNTGSSYGYSPFYRNTSLRTVVITDKETEISENEFYGCTNLQDVKIGDGVESFGNWAFSGCSSLKHLSFGTNVAKIGKEAFSDCTSVTQIVSRAQQPPVCGTQALDDINKWDCTLLVPAESINAYRAADQWKEFFFMEEYDTGVARIASETQEGAKYYSPEGKPLDRPQRGLNIVVMQNGTVRKVFVK